MPFVREAVDKLLANNLSENWITYFERTTELPSYFSYRKTLFSKLKRYTVVGDLILEIGAGTGWSSVALAQMRRQVVALDVQPSISRGIKKLARNLAVEINVVCADMKALPFRNEAFRIVFSQGVLEHFKDDDIVQTVMEQFRVAELTIIDVPTNKAKGQPGAHGDERWLGWKQWKKLVLRAGACIHGLYGGSPDYVGYLLPFFLWKLIGYRFAMAIGIICSRKGSKASGRSISIKERLID